MGMNFNNVRETDASANRSLCRKDLVLNSKMKRVVDRVLCTDEEQTQREGRPRSREKIDYENEKGRSHLPKGVADEEEAQ